MGNDAPFSFSLETFKKQITYSVTLFCKCFPEKPTLREAYDFSFYPPAFEGFGGGRGLAVSSVTRSLVQSLDTEICGPSLTGLEPAQHILGRRSASGAALRALGSPGETSSSHSPLELHGRCPEVHSPGAQGRVAI